MRYLCLAVVAIALTGCIPNTDNVPIPGGDKLDSSAPPSKPVEAPPNTGNTAPDRTSTGVDTPTRPDNTGVNTRDSDGTKKTPIDQDETASDVKITADIRKQILATEGMSINARNAKIITSQGRVTLRGPVNDDEEKATIEKMAMEVAGAGNVTSELEVAK